MTAVATRPAPPEDIRAAVRALLVEHDAFGRLDPGTRIDIAQGLVRICSTARALEAEMSAVEAKPRVTFARAQSAGSEFSGVAADKVAGTTRQILNAVSFPRFVTELITGVFKAMVDSNQQQMHSYVELIKNVAATTEGFADANVGTDGARSWLAERFPGSFVVEGETDDFAEPGKPPEKDDMSDGESEKKLKLRAGASMPTEAALRTALGLAPGDSVPGGDPENLVGPARVAMARNRQQMLATMVMLGLQRIVIDSGRLHAAMRFHIDTRSAAADDRGSSFDLRNETSASGKFGYGPWGAEASVKNTIGYVSTQKTQTTEEMNTDLDLDSSVELVFRTDYVPLERLAGTGDVNRIRVNTLNPDAEMKIATDERKARLEAEQKSEATRGADLDKLLAPPPSAAPPSKPPTPPAQTSPTAGGGNAPAQGGGANQGAGGGANQRAGGPNQGAPGGSANQGAGGGATNQGAAMRTGAQNPNAATTSGSKTPAQAPAQGSQRQPAMANR